jgi:CheY-like chemotaxis protein/anti-sigma regulatory factor (Ser/Thr protein kinase)
VALPDEDVAVMGDAYRLRQVFTNLLSNAAKFTARGARVDIASSVRRDRVSVAISDDGEGMEPSRVASVFEPFAQGSQALERSRGGLGLGLPIARAIVELHGGSLTARSDGEGRGSRFTVRLPLAGPHGIVEAAEQAPTDRLASLSRQRVLVVDDNQDAADMLGALLRNAGFEVDVAYDGPAALAAADIARPDVAILDIGLPTMDGYELARKLRERTGDRPPRLVALTGYGHTEAKERSRAAGFAAHIVKPVDTHRLRELVEALAD